MRLMTQKRFFIANFYWKFFIGIFYGTFFWKFLFEFFYWKLFIGNVFIGHFENSLSEKTRMLADF